jgi:hypothetical protein
MNPRKIIHKLLSSLFSNRRAARRFGQSPIRLWAKNRSSAVIWEVNPQTQFEVIVEAWVIA